MCLWQLIQHFPTVAFNTGYDEPITMSSHQQNEKMNMNRPHDVYLYALGVAMGSVLMTLCHHPQFFSFQHIGMKCRVAISSLVYSKVRVVFKLKAHFYSNYKMHFFIAEVLETEPESCEQDSDWTGSQSNGQRCQLF